MDGFGEEFFEGLCNFLIKFFKGGEVGEGIGEDEEGEDMEGEDSESDDDGGEGLELEVIGWEEGEE